jgi:hypothetical protein
MLAMGTLDTVEGEDYLIAQGLALERIYYMYITQNFLHHYMR